jgi:hypothetical protein
MENLCPKCYKDACLFYEYSEDNMQYFLCKNCGHVWREHAGQVPYHDTFITDVELMEALPLLAFEALTEATVKHDMEDYMHRCFVCQTIAFEVDLGFYQCASETCGFSWEVHGSE